MPRLPRLQYLRILTLILGGMAVCGCTLIRVPDLSLHGFDPFRKSPAPTLLASPEPAPTAEMSPTPPPAMQASPAPPARPPLAIAMQRARSHYDRGLHAMGRGDADQAEWEFDIALQALLDTPSSPSRSHAERGRTPAAPDWSWLSKLAAPHRAPPAPPLLPDGSPAAAAARQIEERPLEAPALLGPDDLKAVEAARPDVGPPLAMPEPDVRAFDFPVVVNDKVKMLLRYFQTRKWAIITRAFERARRYSGMMRAIFREQGLPEDLVNVAFIESAVNPRATSRAKAAGIWQFMSSTGRLYGLRKSVWVDERRDPEKSTRGAATYLKTLYDRFGSWPLALAAYNAGEGAVQRAVRRQRTEDYWSLRLPKETRLYVPAFMAMTIIARDPERYGFFPPPEEPYEVELLELEHPSDLRLIARAAGTSEEYLRELNPELVRGATPPNPKGYALRIPRGVTQAVAEALAQVPPSERVSWTAHTVRKGETAASIAKHYRLSVSALFEANELPRRRGLTPGTTIVVPRIAALAPSPHTGSAAVSPTTDVRHTVRKGETLARLAKKYRVSSAAIRERNGLAGGGLRVGQRLTIPAPVRRASAADG